MSLAEITSKCFQNGVSVQKWSGLCRLLKDKQISTTLEFEADLSNSVLTLFHLYPADLSLQAYLKHALRSGLLSLPVLVSTFLQAAKSPSHQDTGTLDMLCKLVQEEHYKTGLPPSSSLVRSDEPVSSIVSVVQDSLSLLRLSYSLPYSVFHNVSMSTSALVYLLLSCIMDVSRLPTTQAWVTFSQINDLLTSSQAVLDGALRHELETVALSLSMLLGDDAKMAQEAQMQTMQLTLGKGDILGPNSTSDTITCSLVLRHLLGHRTSVFGAGNMPVAVATLLATFRSSLWPPAIFYTQLFLSAVHCLAQGSTHQNTALLWKSFIITRLPALLPKFQEILLSEHIEERANWNAAMSAAVVAVHERQDLLTQCDTANKQPKFDELHPDPDTAKAPIPSPTPFFRTFLHYLTAKMQQVEPSIALVLDRSVEVNFTTQLELDSLDSGLELDAYIDSRLAADTNGEESLAFLQRAIEDVPNHPQLGAIVEKRFTTLCHNGDIEGLGHLCRILNLHDVALDVISLHIKFTDVLSRVLAFVEDFDCESVGDPQTAVSHLGDVILFLQSTLVRYELAGHPFALNGRSLRPYYLLSTSTVFRGSELSQEEQIAFMAWFKALFDSNSEGIEDSILRATKPKILLQLASSLVSHAIAKCNDHKMEQDVLNNGISYFTGPLLNWTLVGVIKALLRDIMQKDFANPIVLEVLQTLVQSITCPEPVLRLTAHGIVALMSETKAHHVGANVSFDAAALRAIANRALGSVGENASTPDPKALTLNANNHWMDIPRRCIQDAISTARAGGAPSLEVYRCVTIAGPTKFLQMLWHEVSAAAMLGGLEIGRRIAGYALTCPPGSNSPPLLPIFLFNLMPALLTQMDAQIIEQSVHIDLLVSIISSSLTTLLHTEWALRTTEQEMRHPMGQPSVTIARKLATDLKNHPSPNATIVMQRLSSSQSFAANFPMMASG